MTAVRILVTGSRHHRDRALIRGALMQAGVDLCAERGPLLHSNVTVVHGAARGADTIAEQEARDLGFSTEQWPADWARDGKAAGPLRNMRMVEAGADMCLAFPLGPSPGTSNCVALARRAGIPVHLHPGETS